MDPKAKYDILKAYALMHKCLLSIENKEDFLFVHCESSEPWWNYVLINRAINGTDLELIEKHFTSLKKVPSIYFSEDLDKELKAFLKNKDYKLRAKDNWLFWEKQVPEFDFGNIIEVKSDAEFETWINTFLKSYPKDDPQNPYGEQTDFANVLKKSWYNRNQNCERYFLAYYDNQPVAVGILTNYEKMGYISAIGSIPSVRGKGFGKKMTLFCVKKSFNIGNRFHFLATEEDDYPYEFYKRIGFIPKFTAYLYTKKLS